MKIRLYLSQLSIFIIFIILYGLFTKTEAVSWNDAARMATIESLVEKGTFVIEQSRFAWTGDKVFINGHFYGGYAPVFPFISAGVYFILNKIFGLSFSVAPHLCYYLLTLLIIVIPSVLMLVFFYKSLRLVKVEERIRWLCTLALGIGTLIFTYTVVFNNHTISAALLFISFYLLLKSKLYSPASIGKVFAAGMLTSLAATIDHVPGAVFLLMFYIYILWSDGLRSYSHYFLIGAVFPITLHLVLNIPIAGDVFPVNLYSGYYLYPGSFFDESSADRTLSGLVRHDTISSWIRYGFHCLVGKRGLFLHTPILVFSVIGLIKMLFDKDSHFRREAIIIFSGIILTLAYYITYTTDYAGCSYSIRYFITIIPLLFFFTAFVFKQKRRRLLTGLFYIVLMISVVMAIAGVYRPWAQAFNFIHNLKTMTTRGDLKYNFMPILKIKIQDVL